MGLRAGLAVSGFGLLYDVVRARTLAVSWLIRVVQSRYVDFQEREKSKGAIPSKCFSRRLSVLCLLWKWCL